LAGLDVTTKSVERAARAIGADIAWQEQQEIQRAMPIDLPVIPGVPVVKKETVGGEGKLAGRPAHSREVKPGCVFTQSSPVSGSM